MPQEECPAFLEQKAELRSLSRGSQAYNEALASLRKLICHKKTTRVCCQPAPSTPKPPTTTTTRKPIPPGEGCNPAQGSCLPGSGECGISSAGPRGSSAATNTGIALTRRFRATCSYMVNTLWETINLHSAYGRAVGVY